VQLLFEGEGVTLNTKDNEGRTPLRWATRIVRGDIVNMLLEHEGVAPNTVDKDGQTPLSWAAKRGHTCVVKMLRERYHVSQGVAHLIGQTTLIPPPKNNIGKLQSGDSKNLGSIPQSAGSNSSTDPFPADPSKSSQHLSKRIGGSWHLRQKPLARRTLSLLATLCRGTKPRPQAAPSLMPGPVV